MNDELATALTRAAVRYRMPAPQLSGDVAFSISPQRPDLQARIDAAIDAVKSDGRFDRINTKYLPFRLQ